MMEDSQHLQVPEQAVLPPSPSGSIGSVDSAPELQSGGGGGGGGGGASTSNGTEDVMITLPLPALRSGSPRTRPPFFKAHVRSRSLAEMPTAPPMLRAHSSPGLDSRGRYIFAAGARGWSPSHHLAPHGTLRRQPSPSDDLIESRLGALHISETISENAELDLEAMSTRAQAEHITSSSPALGPQAFPRIGRRRPSSPLQTHAHVAGGTVSASTATSHVPSLAFPVTPGSKYNESFPGYSASSGSSMPSTPTSLRSRSPSISSLETIPDIPDAEAEAMEADRIAALKAAADRAEAASEDAGHAGRRRGTTDPASPSGGVNLRSTGLGGYGIRTDKRKRWSVCGAERRQDLDLETIWED